MNVRKSQEITVELRSSTVFREQELTRVLERSLRPDHEDTPHKLHKVSQLVHSLNKPGVNAFDVIQVLEQVDYLLGSIEAILEPNKVPDTRMIHNNALHELTRFAQSNYRYGNSYVRNPHSITPVSF